MTVGARHERFERRSSVRMVEDLIVELDIFANALGSTTFKKQSGIERGRRARRVLLPRQRGSGRVTEAEIDLEFDPPPDLVIEVEITHLCWNSWQSTPGWASRRSGEYDTARP